MLWWRKLQWAGRGEQCTRCAGKINLDLIGIKQLLKFACKALSSLLVKGLMGLPNPEVKTNEGKRKTFIFTANEWRHKRLYRNKRNFISQDQLQIVAPEKDNKGCMSRRYKRDGGAFWREWNVYFFHIKGLFLHFFLYFVQHYLFGSELVTVNLILPKTVTWKKNSWSMTPRSLAKETNVFSRFSLHTPNVISLFLNFRETHD